jgi:hypothetical protein
MRAPLAPPRLSSPRKVEAEAQAVGVLYVLYWLFGVLAGDGVAAGAVVLWSQIALHFSTARSVGLMSSCRKMSRKQTELRIVRDELWLARHPDEDTQILDRYRARIRELRLHLIPQASPDPVKRGGARL